MMNAKNLLKKTVLFLSVLPGLNPGKMFAQSSTLRKPVIEERVINVDFNKTAGKLNTMFKECVGAGRANEGLRADWQQQLAYVKKECGFRYMPSKLKGKLKINMANVPNGNYALEVYKVGYRSNDAYSTYLSMGKPSQLTRQQVEQIKKQIDGSPIIKEIITKKDGAAILKELEIRENDVFFLNIIKL